MGGASGARGALYWLAMVLLLTLIGLLAVRAWAQETYRSPVTTAVMAAHRETQTGLGERIWNERDV